MPPRSAHRVSDASRLIRHHAFQLVRVHPGVPADRADRRVPSAALRQGVYHHGLGGGVLARLLCLLEPGPYLGDYLVAADQLRPGQQHLAPLGAGGHEAIAAVRWRRLQPAAVGLFQVPGLR